MISFDDFDDWPSSDGEQPDFNFSADGFGIGVIGEGATTKECQQLLDTWAGSVWELESVVNAYLLPYRMQEFPPDSCDWLKFLWFSLDAKIRDDDLGVESIVFGWGERSRRIAGELLGPNAETHEREAMARQLLGEDRKRIGQAVAWAKCEHAKDAPCELKDAILSAAEAHENVEHMVEGLRLVA